LAKRHMAEAAFVTRPIPFDTILISVLLEQQKALERLERLERQLEAIGREAMRPPSGREG
jgi:hypothetical protein